jgi:threonine dehydratase
MWAALRRGRVVSLDEVRTIAAGLAASVTWKINLAHVQHCVEYVILVSDQVILDSMLFCWSTPRPWHDLREPRAVPDCLPTQRRGRAVAVMSGGNVSRQQIDGLRQVQATQRI